MEARHAQEESRFVLANESRSYLHFPIYFVFDFHVKEIMVVLVSLGRARKSVAILIYAIDEHINSYCHSIVLLPEE